ncbi:MAG: hypothetical protein FWF43_02770 [Propionibacteriaceae bacterium]|nr:hypothetical protein [Propionibacteriaceae bacterium]
MSNMDMTIILDDLAAGRIDAAEAKRRIDALGQDYVTGQTDQEVSTEWPTAPRPQETHQTYEQPPEQSYDSPPKADRVNGVSKVLVKATGRKVRIVGDPVVSTAAAEDVHQVKRNGSVLEIHGDKEFSGVIDALSWVRSVRGVDDVKALGIGKDLTVRVNPTLEVDIDLTGCSLVVSDLPHIGKVRLTAGSATVSGVHMISDLLLQAGQATISGRFLEGWSRLRCESGQVVVEVSRDSDVDLRADAQLGRVAWEGCESSDGEVVLGSGTAHLDVGVVFGNCVIKVV